LEEPRATTPVLLGAAGLLPFLAGAAGTAALTGAGKAAAASLSLVYGMIILAFLGGVHWGHALRRGRPLDFVWAVTPSLIGLLAALLPSGWALAVLGGGFVLAGAYDVAFFARRGPRWYVRLRIALTVIVTVALAVASATAPTSRPAVDLPALSPSHQPGSP
jgi:hypothetical protein